MNHWIVLAENAFALPAWLPRQLLMQASAAVGVLWILLSLFIYWRRKAVNLTPVDVPRVNPAVQPDFLRRNLQAREDALQRADAADERLRNRDATPQPVPAQSRMHRGWKLLALPAVALSVLTLAAVLTAVIAPDSAIGRYVMAGSSSVVKEHPLSIALSIMVLMLRFCVLVGDQIRTGANSGNNAPAT